MVTNLLLLVVLGNSIVDILRLSPLGDNLVSFLEALGHKTCCPFGGFWSQNLLSLSPLGDKPASFWRLFAAFTPYKLGCILVSGTIFDFSEHDNNNSAIGTEIPHYRVTKLAL